MTLAYDMERLVKAVQDVAALSKEIFRRHGRQLDGCTEDGLAIAAGYALYILEALGAAPAPAQEEEGGPAK